MCSATERVPEAAWGIGGTGSTGGGSCHPWLSTAERMNCFRGGGGIRGHKPLLQPQADTVGRKKGVKA